MRIRGCSMTMMFCKRKLHTAFLFSLIAVSARLSAAECDSLESRFARVKSLEGGELKSVAVTLDIPT